MHNEEHDHAIEFLNYVKMRGGLVNLATLQPPNNQDWQCPLHAFKVLINLKIIIIQKIIVIF